MSSRLFNDATPDYISGNGAPVTAAPLTMACWAKLDDTTNVDTLMSIGVSTGDGNFFGMDVAGALAGDPLRISASAGAGGFVATTVGTTAYDGSWHHFCGVWTNATTRDAYFDGSNTGQTPNTISRIPSGLNLTRIGVLIYEGGSTTTNPASGKIALPAIWNVALDPDEITAIATRRVHHRRMRPLNLVSLPPLWGNHSPEIDLVNSGLTWTVTGTSRAEDGPPVGLWAPYRPSIIVPAAVAGGTILPQMIQQGLYANG